jgi:D-3-phosphoglycerate dehydrogenase / 2-oxoglutarate reductase
MLYTVAYMTDLLSCTLVFDFDSTLIDTETLELLAEEALRGRTDAASVLKEVQDITDLGMNGEIPLQESFRRRFALLSLTRAHIEAVTSQIHTHLTPSVVAHSSFFAAHASQVYVVSGGFRECMLPATRLLGITDSHVFGNVFIYDDAGAVMGLDTRIPTCHSGGKADVLRAIVATTQGIVHPVIMVGDGFVDTKAKCDGGADFFFAYTETIARGPVVALADKVCVSIDEVIASAQALSL